MTKEEVLQAQLQAINDLYISERGKYILQNKDGTYSHSNAFKNNKRLTDPIVIRHLKRQSTLGVFCPKKSIKFITFDVDLEGESESCRREVVDNIIKHILNVGIDRRFIYVSLSGSKGYHITLYFSDMVYLNLAYKFYEYVIFSSGYNNLMIEFRPTNEVGVKIPLSLNKKTSTMCKFVDNNFNPIDDPMYICGAVKYDRDLFQEYTKDLIVNYKQYSHLNIVYNRLSQSKIKKLSVKEIEDIEKFGIQQSGTRNYCSVQLAIMYNMKLIPKEIALNMLNDWIDRQDKSTYKTNITRCYIENKKIIEWAYNNNVRYSGKEKKSTIYITRKEGTLLHRIDNIHARRVALALLIHSKVYDLEEFTMTYTQLQSASGVSNRRYISKALTCLIDNEMIKVNKQLISTNKHQNVYTLNYKSKNSRNTLYVVDINSINYIDCLPKEVLNLIEYI